MEGTENLPETGDIKTNEPEDAELKVEETGKEAGEETPDEVKVEEEAEEEIEEEAEEEIEEEAGEIEDEVEEEVKDEAGEIEEEAEVKVEEEVKDESSGEKTGTKPLGLDIEEIEVIDSGDLLVPLDDEKYGYLTHGVHIGLKYRTSDMRPFIYKIRPDKLCVFEVSKIDKRIKTAAKFISRFNPKDVLVVSNREYGKHPIKKFAEETGCVAITKRFVSGTLTNPDIGTYTEPKLIIITDPSADLQAIKEAAETGIATIAICDTNTRFKNLDFIIPGNNKGKNALALIYWLMAREISKINGKEPGTPYEKFVSRAEPQPYLLKMRELQMLSRRRQRGKPRR